MKKVLFFLSLNLLFSLAFAQKTSVNITPEQQLEHFVNYYKKNPTQKESEGDYFDGLEHGKWTYWYPNGQLKQEAEFNYGRYYGKVVLYYENGKKEDE